MGAYKIGEEPNRDGGPVTEALEFARGYTGTLQFMLEMKEKAQNPKWWPTNKQVAAILNCKYRSSKRRANSVGPRGRASTLKARRASRR